MNAEHAKNVHWFPSHIQKPVHRMQGARNEEHLRKR